MILRNFRQVSLLRYIGRLLLNRAASRIGAHQHDWIREVRVTSPPVDVFGCNCGIRRWVLRGIGLTPDHIHDAVVNEGGSPANALNVITGMNMGHFAEPSLNGVPPLTLTLK